MKKCALALSFLLAFPVFSDVSQQNGRFHLEYDFSEDHALAVCFGFGYLRHQCESVPTACVICKPSDSPSQCQDRVVAFRPEDLLCKPSDNRSQCAGKVAAASPEVLRASLPMVSRLLSGAQRGVCTGIGTDDPQCESKITAAAGAIGLEKGHCAVADHQNVTADEWKACETEAARRGLYPASTLDEHDKNGTMVGEVPHFQACLNFIDFKTARPLREARDAGRTWLSEDAAEEPDLSDDEP